MEQSQEMNNQLRNLWALSTSDYDNIRDVSSSGVYLYGAGFVGRWSISYLEGLGIKVLGFVDSDSTKWNSKILGKAVLSPRENAVIEAKAIIITARHAVNKVKLFLGSLTKAKIMSIDAFVVCQQGFETIERLEQLFSSDVRSLDTVRAVLIAMLEGSTRSLADYADNRPFFDRFGFFNRNGEVFVDAGAYVGDSIERFIWSVNGVFKKIYAFEPSHEQYIAMQKRIDRLIAEWGIGKEYFALENKAISNRSSNVRMKRGNQMAQNRIEFSSSPLDDFGAAAIVETVSLDEYFKEQGFTFLKVDIEGSELDLLDGAINSIQRDRPRIALSVYHFPLDIFSLPFRTQEINGDYEFILGHHSSQLMDTVLYCRDKGD